MIPRKASATVRHRLSAYPAVALIGPRQSGKTTLARAFGGHYFDLEQDTDRLRLDLGWNSLVQGQELVVLDEARSWPEVFPRLRGAIDQDRGRKGRFLLLGSVSPSLMVQVSESLAGRLSLVEMTPFLLDELEDPEIRDRLWFYGGYPDGGVLVPAAFPQWQLDYLSLLVQRDLPAWGLPAKPQLTQRLLRMLAAVHGQSWNASNIGQSLGLNYKTVNGYMDYLEGAFLIRRLPAYHANIRKRLVKTPKVYWRDTGLLHALLHLSHQDELLNQPWVGASWEGFVIKQVLGALRHLGINVEAFYLRTNDQYEIDLILNAPVGLVAIEVKLTSSPSPQDMARLNKIADMIDAKKRILVSQVEQQSGNGVTMSCNLPWLIEYLEEIVVGAV